MQQLYQVGFLWTSSQIAFSFETPKTLFRKDYISGGIGVVNLDMNPWDIHPDGKRFLMMKPVETADSEPATTMPRKINIVVNWLEELKKRAPVK